MNKGVLYAAGAYLMWGFLPVYWKSLAPVPAGEILSHRIAWSLVFLLALTVYRRQRQSASETTKLRRNWLPYVLSAALLGVNWFTYIWAVNAGFIVETSLGYFINPLMYVFLGTIFLGESIHGWQWAAILVATFGVGWLTVSYGALPWIALTLATTFSLYGLIKKTAALDPLEGLTLEMGFLFLPALGYLIFLGSRNSASFASVGPTITALLVLSGVVTAVPLLLFAAGARRIRLVTVGILQYIAPTFQFLLGVYLYGEPFTQKRLVGFSFIWLALLIYTADGILKARRQARLSYAD